MKRTAVLLLCACSALVVAGCADDAAPPGAQRQAAATAPGTGQETSGVIVRWKNTGSRQWRVGGRGFGGTLVTLAPSSARSIPASEAKLGQSDPPAAGRIENDCDDWGVPTTKVFEWQAGDWASGDPSLAIPYEHSGDYTGFRVNQVKVWNWPGFHFTVTRDADRRDAAGRWMRHFTVEGDANAQCWRTRPSPRPA